MKYSFNCYGHENITAKHKTTLEFTKDENLGLEGDCIVGVKADFDLEEIRNFIDSQGNNRKITIIIKPITKETNNIKIINNKIKKLKNNEKDIIEKINAEINPDFNSDEEMVIRKSDFVSERTLAIRVDKASFELNRALIGFLKSKKNKIEVIVENRL